MTLPEVLVAIVVMGIVAVTICAAITVTLRTVPKVQATADEAAILQGVVTWLPYDVDAAIPGSFDLSPTKSTGCVGGDVGTNLVYMMWQEKLYSTTTTYVAAYRYVPSGSASRIVRVTCSGAGSLGAATIRNASTDLPNLPSGWVPGQAPVAVIASDTVSITDPDTLNDQLRITVTTLTGKQLYVDTASKNPNETVPPTSVTPTVPAPTTAAPTTTTIAVTTTTIPTSTSVGETTTTSTSTTSTTSTTTTTTIAPCQVTNVLMSPTSVKRINNQNFEFQADVTISITINPATNCTGLTLQYDGVTNTESPRNFPTTSPVKSITIPKNTAEDWAVGTYQLRVMDNTNTQRAVATLTVTP